MRITELHRHLDVCMRPETLLSLAQEKGLEAQSTSLDSFKKKLLIKQPMKDLDTVLAQFSLFQKVLDRPEVLERNAFETVEDCWNEGVRRVELRYSPGFVCQYNQLTWEDTLYSFQKGIDRAIKKYPEMQAGLICIAERNKGVDEVDQVIEFFLKNSSHFIGLDLAGNELDFPCRIFEKSFQKAIQKGAKITIHAGEATGPENMWQAIELLGAQRIGHGVTSIQDPQLVKYLAEKKICLEVCPTSNWLTGISPSLPHHPLPKLLRAGVPVSVNTDDPGIFGVTFKHEVQVCMDQMGMSSEEIQACYAHAYQASFLEA